MAGIETTLCYTHVFTGPSLHPISRRCAVSPIVLSCPILSFTDQWSQSERVAWSTASGGASGGASVENSYQSTYV
jgi:hypothetical protein